MIGKLPPDALVDVILTRTGASDPDILQGPAYGEDTAAIRLDDHVLVVSADPLSLAADEVGTLAVYVVCNDVAASGANPRWATNTMFLPDDDPAMLDTVTAQVDRTARKLGVSIVGGHTEYAPSLERPLLALTAMGLTERYVPTGGASVGDAVLLTAGSAIEATAILATDFAGELAERGVSTETIERGATYLEEISVIEAASAIRQLASGMHDPTEGGVLSALVEMATATGHTFEIDRESIPVRADTRRICDAMDVDPLCVFASGALIVTVPPDAVADATGSLDAIGVESSVIGSVVAGEPVVRLDGQTIMNAPRDHLYDLWE